MVYMGGKKFFVLSFFSVFFGVVFLLAGGIDLVKKEIIDFPRIQIEAEDVDSLKIENNLSDNINTETKTEIDSLKSAEVPEGIKKSDVEKKITPPSPLVVEEKYNTEGRDIVFESDIIFFTNLEREKEGLEPLNKDNLLMEAAGLKLKHMFDNQYFAHVAPSGEDFSYWVENVKYKYITVGENLAMGSFKDGKEMVKAWMESPGHRANILKEEYEEIGVAVGYGKINGNEVCLGVQTFAIPLSSCPTIDETLKTKIDSLENTITEIEEPLKSMQQTLSLSQPTTQSEYDEYNNLVEQYNELVAEKNAFVESLKSTVIIYNNQIKAFNSCIDSK